MTATIRPLSREPLPKALTATSEVPKHSAPPPVARKPKGRSPHAPAATAAGRATVSNTLDASWDRRLRSGAVEPDRILDLHGHSLDTAWAAIDRALERAIVNHDRLLLLITGHVRDGEPPIVRGRIRAAVYDWLAVSRYKGRIAAVRGAHRRHGGGGSLYIVLRR